VQIKNKNLIDLNIEAFKAFDSGDFGLSAELFKQSLSIEKTQPEILYSLAFVLSQLNLKAEAIDLYQKAINLKDDYVDAIYNLAILFYDLKKFDESLEMFNQALAINPSAEVYNNKALVLKELKRFDDAIEIFNAAINVDSEFALAYVEIAGIFFSKGLRGLSVDNYKKALIANPLSTEAHVGLGLIYLSEKNFTEGWSSYGFRTRMPDVFMMSPRSNKPLFTEANNGELLIVAEQGIGDHLLYMSLIQDFYVIKQSFDVAINPKLISLLNRSFGDIKFISSKNKIDDSNYNFQLPMGSIGYFTRPTVESFKTQPKKFLQADEALTNQLKNQLKEDGKYICGIAWKSKNEDFGQDKSIALESMLSILKLPHITFVNLQYGDTKNEIEALNKMYGIQIKTIDEIDNFNDIDGLASLIDACDFVVTTSNVTVHLAGGLGKETYLMVPFAQGRIWYWHEDDTQSIWYPSVNIHRQPNLDNWEKPINDIAHILENKKN